MAAAEARNWQVASPDGVAAFACRDGKALLAAMIDAGRSAIRVGCRSGGCGVCRVKVTRGSYRSEKMTRSRITQEDEAAGIVLACRIYPASDLAFEPMPLEIGKVRA